MLLPGMHVPATSGMGESLAGSGLELAGSGLELEPLGGAGEPGLLAGGRLADSRIGEALKQQMEMQKQLHQQLVRVPSPDYTRCRSFLPGLALALLACLTFFFCRTRNPRARAM
jgi:hypothetical protein